MEPHLTTTEHPEWAFGVFDNTSGELVSIHRFINTPGSKVKSHEELRSTGIMAQTPQEF
jgi:hypothetical protein